MRLYVCWGTWKRPGVESLEHACGAAYHALREAGVEPELVRSGARTGRTPADAAGTLAEPIL